VSDNETYYFCSTATKWFILNRNRNFSPTKYEVHPINRKRFKLGEYEYLRMEPLTFDCIMRKIQTKFVKQWKNCHKDPLCGEEKLVITK
jgi:hypothetical protein